jgi:stage IV sporulation protein FB
MNPMLTFQSPPYSRFDLNFRIAGIPVRVHPLFWLMGILFGISGGLLELLVWVPVVFVSILLHELGHALAFRRYGQPSHIVLYMGGGLTVPEQVWWGGRVTSVALRPGQEIAISLSGPAAGFLLAGLVLAGVAAAGGTIGLGFILWIIPFPVAYLPQGGWIINTVVSSLLWVNIFWGLINLMPVQPLDGGNVMRNVLIGIDPWNGTRKALYVSLFAGIVLVLVGLLMRQVFLAFLFGMLAFQSYMQLRGDVSGY